MKKSQNDFSQQRRKEGSLSQLCSDESHLIRHDDSRASCLPTTVSEAITNYKDHYKQ